MRRNRAANTIPTSSMADIAFLLLIFFLVTTVFDVDKGLALVLPQPGETQDIPAKNLIFFTVDVDGLVEVRRGQSPQIQMIRADQVAGIWRLDVAQNENLIAAVRTHPDASYRHMIAVLDQLKQAKAQRISVQVLKPM